MCICTMCICVHIYTCAPCTYTRRACLYLGFSKGYEKGHFCHSPSCTLSFSFLLCQLIIFVSNHLPIGGPIRYLKAFFSSLTTIASTASSGLFHAMEFSSSTLFHQHILKTGKKYFIKERKLESIRCDKSDNI